MWLEKRATLTEITDTMSIDDLETANRALDAWQTAERNAKKGQ